MTRTAAAAFDSGEEVAYRSVSVKAVVGLVLGAFSALALIHPLLWIVPAAAVALSLLALREIGLDDNRLVGRGAALAGLAVALFFGTAAAGAYYARRAMAIDEARQTADIWFDRLQHDEPHRAHQLSLPPNERFPIDEPNLWEAYRGLPKMSAGLTEFVEKPAVAALLKLGPRAKVRFYSTEGYATGGKLEGVKMLYAVTYGEGQRPRTFFVQLAVVRRADAPAGQNPWYVADIESGVRPPGW